MQETDSVTAQIVTVEDEDNLRSNLVYALEKEGFEVKAFADGALAWEAVQHHRRDQPRVYLLDIMLPRMDGIELCRRIRARDPETPVMFLSSRDEEFDRVLGLELGADDYLCKPFSMRELMARLKALLKRGYPDSFKTRSPAGSARLVSGDLVLDKDFLSGYWSESSLHLTVSEFRILWELAERPGTVKTREQLQLAAYPEDLYVNERSVDCHIKRIRKKLVQAAGSDPLQAVYGLGYKFVAHAGETV